MGNVADHKHASSSPSLATAMRAFFIFVGSRLVAGDSDDDLAMGASEEGAGVFSPHTDVPRGPLPQVIWHGLKKIQHQPGLIEGCLARIPLLALRGGG
jgi:hypothetical protein